MSINIESYPYLNPEKDRRVALVTGGNSGIGFYTVLHLYLHGYVVYVAGRSKSRVIKSMKIINEQAEEIRTKDGAEVAGARFLGEMHFLEIDLLDLKSVLDAVSVFKSLEPKLDILVNNAGIMARPFSETTDGFEIQMQTNYVAPFLLTTKLLPLLEAAADKEHHTPRVIYLSTVGHHLLFKYFDLSSTFNYIPNIVFTWFRYAMAKTAGIHLMKMLALRNPKLLCMSVHPGLVMNTRLFSYWTRLPIVGIAFWCFFQIVGYFFGVSNEDGAYSTLKCCLDPSITPQKDNGKYYTTNGEERNPSRVARNMDYAAQTWIWTIHKLSEKNIHI